MLNIAKAFQNGQGVLPDNRVAAENYWRAAERGNAEGAYSFAVMLRDGVGVGQDLPRALKYFNMAAQQNYGDAAECARKLRDKGISLPGKPKTTRTQASAAAKKVNKTKSTTSSGKKSVASRKKTSHKKKRK